MAAQHQPGGGAASDAYEQLEKARQRIKQKKRLYYHFVVFLVGSVFLIIINKFLKVKEEWDWFVWVIVLWAFLLVIHTFNVFITHKFLGKDWEEKQREKLVARQRARIEKLKREVEKEFPLPGNRKDPSSR